MFCSEILGPTIQIKAFSIPIQSKVRKNHDKSQKKSLDEIRPHQATYNQTF